VKHQVACMDVWSPAVQHEVRRAAPPELELLFAQSYGAQEQLLLVRDAEILLPGFAAVTEPLLLHARYARMVQKWGIGVDSIDLAAVRRRGLTLAITARH